MQRDTTAYLVIYDRNFFSNIFHRTKLAVDWVTAIFGQAQTIWSISN